MLRTVVKQRAAILYVTRDRRLQAFLQARNAVEGVRAATSTSVVAGRDLDLATELADTAQQLEVREARLKVRQGELRATMEALRPLEEELQRRLQLATGVYDRVRRSVGRTAAGRGANRLTGATRCPVDGFTIVNNNYGHPRPDDRAHEGVDLFALAGIPLLAVVDGYVRHEVSELGGTGIWLEGHDQVTYYYAHLSRWEGGERTVAAGEVIGYVGNTGDATGPHLQFQVHPGGSAPVDPYALLTVLCAEESARRLG